ncbi:lipase family protein [Nocardioides litoris]|uniref:lipase family protein n=1 Tax=Nocardioides litoris TaxID=1926648 RepID=UPI001FE36FD1|nr:lipase family protein [Nocardioides litoris]
MGRSRSLLVTLLALVLGAGVLVSVPVAPASASAATAPVAARQAAAAPFQSYQGTRAQLRKMKRGQVIKTRTLTYSVQGIPLPIRVVQLLYRTTDQRGRATWNATSILKPPVALHPDRVVAYGSFYDSLNPLDGPSYAVAGGRSSGTSAVHAETALVTPFLLAGYSVVMADTQGRTADFAAGPEYGYTTLDSLRAALASPAAGIAAQPDIALFGYSGGAIATNWAATLAPTYAPDINRRLVGAAEGGVLVAPDNNLPYVSGSQVWAGVAPMALVGAARAFGIDLRRYLSARGKRIFRALQKAPIADVLGRYPGLRFEQLVKRRYRDPASIPEYVRTVNQLNLGLRRSPTVPMFIGQGAGGEVEGTPGDKPGIGPGDGVMIAGDVRTLARKYCNAGTRVRYQQYPLSHFTTVPLWLPDAIAWTEARFAGRAAPSSCGSIPPGTSLARLKVRR